MNNRRFLALLLSLCLTLSSFNLSVFAGDVTVYPSDAIIKANSISVPFCIENNTQGFAGFGFEIIYDKDSLSPTGYSLGEVLQNNNLGSNFTYNAEKSENSLMVASANSENTYGDGVLFYIDFVTKSENVNTTIQIIADDFYNEEDDEHFHSIELAVKDKVITNETTTQTDTTTETTTQLDTTTETTTQLDTTTETTTQLDTTTETTTQTDTTTETTTQTDTTTETTTQLDINPKISTKNISVYKDSVIRVPVSIENNVKGFAGFGVSLEYDSDIIAATDFGTEEVLSGQSLVFNPTKTETQCFLTLAGSENIYGNGDLFYVDFVLFDESVTSSAITISFDEIYSIEDNKISYFENSSALCEITISERIIETTTKGDTTTETTTETTTVATETTTEATESTTESTESTTESTETTTESTETTTESTESTTESTESTTEYLMGDVDRSGIVDAGDCAMVMLYVSNKIKNPLDDEQFILGDVDYSNVIDAGDAASIMLHVCDKIKNPLTK